MGYYNSFPQLSAHGYRRAPPPGVSSLDEYVQYRVINNVDPDPYYGNNRYTSYSTYISRYNDDYDDYNDYNDYNGYYEYDENDDNNNQEDVYEEDPEEHDWIQVPKASPLWL